MMNWTCSTSCHVPPWKTLTVSAYSNYGCVNWYRRSPILHVQLPTLFLQVDLATSQGLRVPGEIIPSTLSVGARNTPATELQRFVGVDRNPASVTVSRAIKVWGLIHHFTTGMLPELNPPRHLSFVLLPIETQRKSARSIRSNTNLSKCFVSRLIARNTLSIDKPLHTQVKSASSCPMVVSRGSPSKEICKRKGT